jgi:hypothetical protein
VDRRTGRYFAAGLGKEGRHSEVEKLRSAAAASRIAEDEHVAGLQIAMANPLRVSERERIRYWLD